MRALAVMIGVGLVTVSSAAAAQTASEADPDQRICRRAPAELGTRIPPKSICKTRAEWEAEAREAQQNMRGRHNPASGDAFRNAPNSAVNGG